MNRWLLPVFGLQTLLFSSVVFSDGYQLTLVEANPAAGFNCPYYLRVPDPVGAATPQVLIVESNNSGVHDEFEKHLEAVAAHASGRGIGPGVASALNQPLLIPVFPRTKARWQLYTHALDRDSIVLKNDRISRLDLQLLRMVSDAQARLRQDEIEVRDKFVLVGFSASGSFSNRFAFLHPERLLAVVSGAINACPMLPVTELKGATLNFPLGIADIQPLTGRPFNAEAWQQLPQLIFIGALDDNDALHFDDAYSETERSIVFKVLALPMAERWSSAQAVYLEREPDVTFITYGQVGHWTDRRINRDINSFVRTEIERANGNNEN